MLGWVPAMELSGERRELRALARDSRYRLSQVSGNSDPDDFGVQPFRLKKEISDSLAGSATGAMRDRIPYQQDVGTAGRAVVHWLVLRRAEVSSTMLAVRRVHQYLKFAP